MADVRFWVAGNRAYAYTPHRQADGKFYAMVYAYDKVLQRIIGWIMKERAFARRKKAKECAYRWYQKRKAVLERLRSAKPVKPAPTKAEILQQKLAKIQQSIKKLTTKKKRLETLLKKQLRRQKYYQKELSLLGEACVG